MSFEESVAAGGEVIAASIARRLRVTLNPSDLRPENEQALDLVSDTRARLIEILRQAESGAGEPVHDVRALAARLAMWACRDLFDERNPSWRQTRDRLHYFLTRAKHCAGYAVWRDADGVELAGLAAWQRDGRAPLDAATIARYLDDPSALSVGPLPAGSVERLKPAGWHHLLSRIFAHLQRPIPLPQLVRLMHALFTGGARSIATPAEPTDDGTAYAALHGVERATADQLVELEEIAARAWAAVRQLPHARRAAYLLNLSRGDGLFTFVAYGAASLRDIGHALALTPEQYEQIWRQLPLDDCERAAAAQCATDDERFAFLVSHLPLRDAVIGAALGIEEMVVSALRWKAKSEIRRAIGDRIQ